MSDSTDDVDWYCPDYDDWPDDEDVLRFTLERFSIPKKRRSQSWRLSSKRRLNGGNCGSVITLSLQLKNRFGPLGTIVAVSSLLRERLIGTKCGFV